MTLLHFRQAQLSSMVPMPHYSVSGSSICSPLCFPDFHSAKLEFNDIVNYNRRVLSDTIRLQYHSVDQMLPEPKPFAVTLDISHGYNSTNHASRANPNEPIANQPTETIETIETQFQSVA